MKRLLIVDDSRLMRDMVAACLRPLGAVTFEYAGTGLGLALSHSFCQMLGGDIQVQSALGQGSTFTVRLPRTSGGEIGQRKDVNLALLA